MGDDWKARLADLLAKIERERTKEAARRAVVKHGSLHNALVAATDLSGRLSAGANCNDGEDE